MLLACGLASGALLAQSVYRCQDASGKIAYQEQPCTQAQQSQTMLPIASYAPPPAPAASRPADAKAPERASITLYYDPNNAPARLPPAAVEEIIAYASQLWEQGCLVDIKYGGRAVYWRTNTPERVGIRWQTGYVNKVHPSHHSYKLGGTGSLATGIELNPTLHELRAVFVHALGHVLGIGHLHGDPTALMGYLRPMGGTLSARPAPIDYLACNLAMRDRFRVPFNAAPADIARVRAAYGMTDRQAVEKMDWGKN